MEDSEIRRNRKPTGGWNAEELRTMQLHLPLASNRLASWLASGVSEAASAGGFACERQARAEPDAGARLNVSADGMGYGRSRKSNLDIGVEHGEINKV
ncbi:MAG: hypothetical protein ACLR6J_14445 [Parabacteroides merdae]